MEAAPLLPAIYQVAAVRRELADVVTLELAPGAGERPAFEPGQFNMLYAFGIGEAAISISDDGVNGDDGRGTFVHTVRKVGATTRAIAALEPGASVGLRGPFGRGWPLAEAEGRDIVIVAGGLGLAPLRPAIAQILAERHRYGRVIVLAGARSPADMLFRAELDAWQQHGDLAVELTVDHADPLWNGHVGVVPSLIARARFDARNAIAFVCGPEVMMRFAASALRDAGLAPGAIHLSMERNMKCAIGLCGHCQFGAAFICKDGPVLPLSRVERILSLREV